VETQTHAPKDMRTFMIVWLGQVISILGSGLTSFALGVWLYDQTGRATPFALTVLFASLPRILLAPLAGSLADRWNRRLLMILSDTGAAVVTLGAVVLLGTGQLQIWHVYMIAVGSAIFGSFQEPAYAASITMLVPKKDLARANGLVQMAQAGEMLVAPLLAGALFTVIGIRGIILIDFVTYFFAVGALLVVTIPQPRLAEEPASQKRGVVWRDVTFGWRYLAARPGLLGLLLYFALVNFFMNLSMVLSGPLVLAFGSAVTLGAVQMASGVGMLVGSLVISAWGGPQRRVGGLLGFIAGAGASIVLIGLRPSGVLIGTGLFLFLFCIPMASGLSQAIFQSKVAPEVQGRVFATRGMISRSITPVAYLLAGPLADFVFEPLMRADGGLLARTWAGSLLGTGPGRGIGLMFVTSGLLLLGATAVAWTHPRIRNVEAELPDALPEPDPAPASPALASDFAD
jgi:MFS transporter, DHA3 family, macrolide efflux protein